MFKKKPVTEPETDPSPPLSTGEIGTPSVAFNPDLPSCPFLDSPNCPYTTETKEGCPYKAMVAEEAINVPDYCPLTQ